MCSFHSFYLVLYLWISISTHHQVLALASSTLPSFSRAFTLNSNGTRISNGTSPPSATPSSSQDAPITTQVFTLTTGGILELPEGIDSLRHDISTRLTFTGPTTVTAAWVENEFRRPATYRLAELETSTFTVDQGTLLFNVGEGTTYSLVSLVGPTTATIVASRPGGDFDAGFAAYDNTADPACHGGSFMTGSAYSSFLNGHAFTAKSPIATLNAGQVLTTALTEGYAGHLMTTVNKTFTGPTTVYSTISEQLLAARYNGFDGPFGHAAPPGMRCGGGCGLCEVFFEVVYVHYWPVENPNTACLGNVTAATTMVAARNGSGPGITVHPRGLSKITAGASTAVLDGFTYTSPLVYIALPSIEAADQCGYIGSKHTSVVLSYDPGQLSTAVILNKYSTEYFPFNFADAQCPPASLSEKNAFTPLGLTGQYNPIISPPAGLTLLDPNWNQHCVLAPFQGNDPPYALKPASNIADPTIVNPLPIQTSPAPSPGIPAPPAQTTGQALASQTAMDPPHAPDSPAGPAVPVATPKAPVPDPKSPPNNPAAPKPQPGPKDPASPKPQPAPNDPANPKPQQPPNNSPGSSPQQPQDNPAPANPQQAPADPANPNPQQPPNDPSNPNTQQSPNDPPSPKPQPAPNDPAAPNQQGPGGPGSPTPNDPTTVNRPGVVIASYVPVVVPQPQAATPSPNPVTIGNSVYTPDAKSQYTVNGQTVKPGDTVTIGGAPVVIPTPPPSNPNSSPDGAPNIAPNVVTVVGQTYTANAASQYTINGQTVKPGDTVTVGGNPVIIPTPAPQIPKPAPNIVTLGGQPYTADAASQYTVNGQTVKAGDSITINGLPQVVPSPAPASVPVPAPTVPGIVLGGTTYTPDASSNYIVAGQTAKPGSTVTISGTPVYIPALPTPQVITLASQLFTADASSNFIINGHTLHPGAPVTLAGSVFLIPTPAPTNPEILTFAGKPYTADASSNFVIDGQTLKPGQAITVSGTPISLAAAGPTPFAVIGTSTIPLAPAAMGPEIFTFGGKPYTADASSNFVINGQTLKPGQAITISGTPISLGAGPTPFAVIGTSTIPLAPAATGPEVFTFAGKTYTADSASDFVVDGKTLTPGGVITVSGTPISLAVDASQTDVVVGTSTQMLGGVIMSGFGGPGASPTGGSTVVPFGGGAGRVRMEWWRVGGVVLGLVSVIMVLL